MNDKQIVDDIIHYLKLNNAGYIDRDNVFDVLVNYIDKNSDSEKTVKELESEMRDISVSIKSVISNLQDLV